MKTISGVIILTFVAFFAACASMAPKELINARSAYQHASEGPAAQLAPAELHKAHAALAQAEESFQKEPDSYKAKDLAYVAQRKSELAGALGILAADKARKEKANADFQKKQTALVKQGKEDLIESEKQGKQDVIEAERQGKQDLIESERKGKQDLIESETRSADALAALAAIAAVKEEKRGLVITLSGSVLFRSGKSALLPSARGKLDQVVNALQSVRVRNLIVEGHTDSQGSESYNQVLSERRAEAVRDYLVQKGYLADHIQVLGKGESSPIGDNISPEGRANNRRVEIVIQREPQLATP